jgi:hypothetical protein
MLRAAVFSLLVLFSIAVVVPIMDASAHAGRHSSARHRKHRHSKAWWRRYHARKRYRMKMARLRALERQRSQSASGVVPATEESAHYAPTAGGGVLMDARGLWSVTMPAGWNSRVSSNAGEVKFRIYTPDGKPAGYSALTPINIPESPKPLLASKARKFIGKVSFTDLRRTVIDKMVTSNGWVTNDYERVVDGKRVFVVSAQTAGSPDGTVGPQPWTFYFTEMDGRVYNLATTAPAEYLEQANSGSEKLLGSFKSNVALPAQRTASR